jgi:signal transduction histidine kinase
MKTSCLCGWTPCWGALPSVPFTPTRRLNAPLSPLRVQENPLALERALSNLMDNAVLFGERVQVRLTRQGARTLVEVRDFGPGIAQASMTAAFEPHVRLSIARSILQAHGGEIRLHNHVEDGLVVTVLLPAISPADALPT